MNITSITPVDISGIDDAGMQACSLFAASLGWNVHRKINQPVILTAKDGTRLNLPTNTSVRFSVFNSAVRKIVTHRDEDRNPTPELVRKVSKEVKLGISHQAVFYNAIGGVPEEDPTEVPETAIEVSVEPTWGHGAFMDKARTKQYCWESEASDKVVWSDGVVTYRCKICKEDYGSAQSVGIHNVSAHGNRVPDKYKGWNTYERARAEGRAYVIDHTTGKRTLLPAKELVRKGPRPDKRLSEPSVAASPELPEQVAEIATAVPEYVNYTGGELSDRERLELIGIIASNEGLDILRAENKRLRAENEKLQSDFDALAGIFNSR